MEHLRMAATEGFHTGAVRWGWVAMASLPLLAAGLFGINKSSNSDVSLRVADIGKEHLRITWDHDARAIQRSAGGDVEIEDGAVKMRGALSREMLLTGNVTYARTSGQVMVRLILRGDDGRTVTELASYTGAPVVVAEVREPVGTIPALPVAAVASAQESEEATPSPRQEAGANRLAAEPARAAAVDPPEIAATAKSPAPAGLRRWVAPAAATLSASAELPSPPAIVESFSTPIPSIIPHTPVGTLPKPPELGQASGKLLWTGKLTRGETLQILSGRASLGRVSGALPGVPVRVRVFATELTQSGLKVFTGDSRSVGVPEAPGAQNGWMQTTWVLDAKKAGDLRIVETPSAENGWSRLSVKAERGDHAVIVLHWDRVPAAH
jgi:hypothetical protein